MVAFPFLHFSVPYFWAPFLSSLRLISLSVNTGIGANQINALTAERDGLSNQHYYVENEEKRAAIQTDTPMLEQYTSAQELQADMDRVRSVIGMVMEGDNGAQFREGKQYLMDKYGLDESAFRQTAPGGYGTEGGLWQLYFDLEGRQAQAADTLKTGG